MRSAMAFLMLLAPAASAAPSFLRNGGFEHGDFRHWTLSGNTQYSQVFDQDYDGLAPHHGQDYALLGAQGSDGILSQSFPDAAGATLNISFWIASDGGATDFFSASFDGRPFMQVGDTGAFSWRHYLATETATGADTLSFSFLDDQDYWALDSVRVTEAAPRAKSGGPIPEPATLLVLPILLLGAALRRRRSRETFW